MVKKYEESQLEESALNKKNQEIEIENKFLEH